MKTPHTLRARWAAIGAAVAVTIGAGGAWVSHAASPPSSVVMVEPARILDTRDGTDLGLPGPFTSPVAQDLQVTGSIPTANGDMTVVPEGATGVLLNVTPVRSTADGFISVRPADATGDPTTSSLNFTAGQTNPNSVQVEIPTSGPDAGKIEISYNALGIAGPSTDVLVDVVGYSVSEVSDDIADLKAQIATIAASQSFSKFARVALEAVGTTDEVVVSIDVTVPVEGSVTVMSAAAVSEDAAGDEVRCSITTGDTIDGSWLQRWESGGAESGQHGQLSGVRLYTPLDPGMYTYNLVCDHVGAGSPSSTLESIALVATFNPAEANPLCDRFPGLCDPSLPPLDPGF